MTVKEGFPEARDHVLSFIKPGDTCMEIGVWKGEYSRRILAREPGKLILVDPWHFDPDQHQIDWFDSLKSQTEMDSIAASVMQWSEAQDGVKVIRQTFSDAFLDITPSFDFIYIDGEHTYTAVREDLHNAFLLMKPSGTIAGDDFQILGVGKAVTEFVIEMPVTLELEGNQFIIRRT